MGRRLRRPEDLRRTIASATVGQKFCEPLQDYLRPVINDTCAAYLRRETSRVLLKGLRIADTLLSIERVMANLLLVCLRLILLVSKQAI